MEDDLDMMTCAHCGFTGEGPFTDHICPECHQTYWKCAECGYVLSGVNPPNACPSCQKKCQFLNATCYTPDCGGPGNFDPRI
jgi:rubrerythrin